jgi:amino acid transporter
MYLRFGWVVGHVGLGGTLLIVTLATSITLLTAFSISAIATAQQVRVGGAYYMISRSLGIETGGAVGIPLFFAQALSVALYTIGFAESLVRVFPILDEKAVAMVTTMFVALVAYKSARAAIKAQYVIMGAIALSLVSFVLGGSVADVASVPAEPAGTTEDFWVVFAVFFPAVTGIMAGVNMSGDLENPGKSIPRGTLAAVGAGYLIYMVLPVLLSLRATSEQLIADPLIMQKIAFWGDAVLLGVWGATLSSAVGSILGAPRVLQALARDGVLPSSFRWLARGSGPDDEPRAGTAVTFGIALITVALGNLNAIAPVLTMFFLTTYGVLNIAAGIERFLGNPSFRPKFRVHWFWSLAGAIGCGAVMFLINAVATVTAIVIVLGIFLWLERQEIQGQWGDVRRGLWMTLTRVGLLNLRSSPDPKNWRPHLLVLSGAPTKRWHLIDLATSITHNRTLMTVSTVATDPGITRERIGAMEQAIADYLRRRGVPCLVRLVTAPTPFDGAVKLVDTYGLGALVPNTVMLGDSESPGTLPAYCDLIRHMHRSRRNTAIVHHNDSVGFGERATIDVWWGGLRGNGALMIILSYLIRTSLRWRGATVRVKMVVSRPEAAEGAGRNLDRILEETRTGAIPEVIVSNGRSFDELLRESSSDADLIFMGLAEPGEDFVAYYESVQRRLKGLPTTILVLSAEELAFGEVLLE